MKKMDKEVVIGALVAMGIASGGALIGYTIGAIIESMRRTK